MQTRPHFLDKRCTFTVDRWPWVTCSLCISCIAIFYAGIDSSNFAYKINNPSAWATPFLYAFFHANSSHLWSNMIIFLLAGIAFEATENTWRLFITVMVSTPLAAGGQGFASENGVIGASGFVYAVIVYQLALVLKNFREMRYRPYAKSLYISVRSVISAATTRLIFGLVLLVAEIVSTQYNNNISHGAHALGAASGILLSMAMGSNVVIDEEFSHLAAVDAVDAVVAVAAVAAVAAAIVVDVVGFASKIRRHVIERFAVASLFEAFGVAKRYFRLKESIGSIWVDAAGGFEKTFVQPVPDLVPVDSPELAPPLELAPVGLPELAPPLELAPVGLPEPAPPLELAPVGLPELAQLAPASAPSELAPASAPSELAPASAPSAPSELAPSAPSEFAPVSARSVASPAAVSPLAA
eukprot:6709049-Prymnesium_polylepis.1